MYDFEDDGTLIKDSLWMISRTYVGRLDMRKGWARLVVQGT